MSRIHGLFNGISTWWCHCEYTNEYIYIKCTFCSAKPIVAFYMTLFSWHTSTNFFVVILLKKKKRVFGSLRTILLCIVGELAWGGLWKWLLILVTGYRWHATHDTGHRHVSCDAWHMKFIHFFFFLNLLSVFVCFCPFWYQCYSPYTLRDSVSPIWGIFCQYY